MCQTSRYAYIMQIWYIGDVVWCHKVRELTAKEVFQEQWGRGASVHADILTFNLIYIYLHIHINTGGALSLIHSCFPALKGTLQFHYATAAKYMFISPTFHWLDSSL